METKNKSLILRLTEGMHERLSDYSDASGVPMSEFIRRAVEDALNAPEVKAKLTQHEAKKTRQG